VFAGDAARAIAFVLPHVRDGFAAGQGAWVMVVLETIIRSVRERGGCGGDEQAALQWWMFGTANFPAISRGLNAFVAAARQWDVQGEVYASVWGRRSGDLGAGVDGGGMKAVVAVAAATAAATTAAAADASAVAAVLGGMGGTYFHNPLRHTFPTACYHQRSRFTFDRAASRASAVRCACVLKSSLVLLKFHCLTVVREAATGGWRLTSKTSASAAGIWCCCATQTPRACGCLGWSE